MTFIEGDKVKIDGHYKKNLEGKVGVIVDCDYETEAYLFKAEGEERKLWLDARYLTRIDKWS